MSAIVCLPVAMLSVLAGPVADHAHAAKASSVRAEIEEAARTGNVHLRLYNGQEVGGVFHSFFGSWNDSVSSEVRYEQWRSRQSGPLPAFGQVVQVVTVAGDTLRGSFRGLGPAFIALRTADSPAASAVSFSTVSGLLAPDGVPVAPWTDLLARFGDAPRLSGVGLQLGANVMVVGREQILSAKGVEHASDSGNTAFGLVLVGIGLVALGLLCVKWSNDLDSSCSKIGTSQRIDRRFPGASLSCGPGAWAPGETRRP